MFERLAELAIRRSRLVLVIAVVAVALMGVLGAGAFTKLRGGGFDDPASQSTRAAKVIDEKFGGETNLVLLVQAPDSRVDTPAATRSGQTLVAELKKEKELTNVVSYWDTGSPDLRSRDGREAMVLAHVTGDETQQRENAKKILDTYTGTHKGALTVQAGGSAAVGHDLSKQVVDDLVLAETIAIPLTLVLLLFVFGSVVAALLPLAIAVIAVIGSFAQLSLLGSVTDVADTATNLTTALGLGLGIDYALLMTSRFREQLAAGASVDDAVRRTVHTAGRTVAFSAATVAAALAALLVFPQYFLRSFGFAGVGVVAIAALGTLFVMPALLAVLGHRVNSGRLPWAKPGHSGARAPMWGRLARTVMRRPALTALPVLAVLLAAASPLLGITFGTPDERVLPKDASSRQVSTALRANFDGSEDSAVNIVIDQPVSKAPLESYAVELSGLQGVVRVETSAGTYAGGQSTATAPGDTTLGRPDAQRISLVSALTPKSDAAQDLVKEVRALAPPTGTHPLVGGTDAVLVDSKDSIGGRLPIAVALVALTTFVLLFLFTGSVVQPLRALVLNVISLAATLGVMTWIFQDGNLSSLLGFTAQPMEMSMTVLMFCIAFGLSMDYEVFVTSRIKELHDLGKDNETAVADGLGHTGRIVSAAAFLLAVSFFAFGTAKISFMQMFGLGSGLAVLIDALAVRGVLVPAAMRLLGRSAWYAPGFLRRLHDRFGLSEGGPEPTAATEPATATSSYVKDATGA
ncbi:MULTISPECIES: MMPL family transporter [unclassified Streptomyces]|uniref:MMPL family transporter n=1 Tax=unclassified Streptomyces TaxID=2593676 RepID=UPI001163DD8E|nr:MULTISPECIES: MMPL family transporter [unclassified Streptomyces]NMI55310.1 MMPL family transporter [Streptomyces sp. RLA2-12]QDN62224.1 MMPL family transporter [Streptomyces sp. S1D4-20]QDN72276.1 MMPL family transporter [Streptomyces sp. S1D4-14]QDO54733.1 MMPL family transporter [Streptomyces sp. RLB3-5]QDO64977.1 MMPL family transporter [Streptomyces sp. RLB1-8]